MFGPGSFVRVVRAIDISVAAGLPVAINTTIQPTQSGPAQVVAAVLDGSRVVRLALPVRHRHREYGRASRFGFTAGRSVMAGAPDRELSRINCPEFKIYPATTSATSASGAGPT